MSVSECPTATRLNIMDVGNPQFYAYHSNDTDSILDSLLNSAVEYPALPRPDECDWKFIMDHVKRNMYNSTSASVPSPFTAICQRTAATSSTRMVSGALKYPTFHPNWDLDNRDLSEYRRLRSEDLMLRIMHCDALDVDKSSISRISKGIFMKSVLRQPTRRIPQPIGSMEDFLHYPAAGTFRNIIRFDDMGSQHQMVCQNLETMSPASDQAFVPYSYTFGARFCDPIHHTNDVLVHGRIPEWCQMFLLSEILNRMPVRPGETITGLLPFAPHIPLSFEVMVNVPKDKADPELTLCYEHFASELGEPEMVFPDNSLDWFTQHWEDRKADVLQKMLYCGIPDNVAQIITTLATAWVTTPGFNI